MPQFQFLNKYTLEQILLISSALLIFSVLASRISSGFGVPALLLFLGIGMLAGSEGPGGIAFDDYTLAFAMGSVSLALIIFDGGLRTSWKSVQSILPLGISLSFAGTVITGAATGIFAHYALGLSWREGLLRRCLMIFYPKDSPWWTSISRMMCASRIDAWSILVCRKAYS